MLSIAQALQTARREQATTTMAMTPMTPISTVTVAVSVAAELATEAAEKEDHEKDEEEEILDARPGPRRVGPGGRPGE